MSESSPLSIVVLTYNEARNLPACLDSVAGWAADIFVVDSGSTDGTLEIASNRGAHSVVNPFTTHARQWAWAMANLLLRTDWVLALDADQRVTPALKAEIDRALRAHVNGPEAPQGYYVRRRQIFRGRWIRHGGYYPKYLLKLFRRDSLVVDEGELVDHHFAVRGPTARLHGDIIEDNANESAIAAWIEKHNRYARLQAQEEHARVNGNGRQLSLGSPFGSPDDRTRWLKQRWARLPLYVRPCLYFFYRYFLRFGFLDGKAGFTFHVMQAFWYRLLVDINLDELRDEDARRSTVVVTQERPNGLGSAG